jgi:hypothetical protein
MWWKLRTTSSTRGGRPYYHDLPGGELLLRSRLKGVGSTVDVVELLMISFGEVALWVLFDGFLYTKFTWANKKYQRHVYEPLQFELGARRCCWPAEVLSHACMLIHVQRVASTMIRAPKDLSMYAVWLVEPLSNGIHTERDPHRSIYANTWLC